MPKFALRVDDLVVRVEAVAATRARHVAERHRYAETVTDGFQTVSEKTNGVCGVHLPGHRCELSFAVCWKKEKLNEKIVKKYRTK